MSAPETIYFIGPHHICCDDTNNALIIDFSTSIGFSLIQYKLLKPLVESQLVPVSDAELVKGAYAIEKWWEILDNLEKHIDKIRSRLSPYDLYVYRVVSYGYVLLPVPDYGMESERRSPRNHP